MIDKEELIKAIIDTFNSSDYGCYVGGRWFSPIQVIRLIEEL